MSLDGAPQDSRSDRSILVQEPHQKGIRIAGILLKANLRGLRGNSVFLI